MKCKYIVGAVAALLVLVDGVALSAPPDNSWYADLDVGRSSSHLKGADIDVALADQGITGSSSVERQSIGLGANAGYRFNRWFALEGGYAYFGRPHVSSMTTTPAVDLVQGVYEAHALSLSAVGIAPLGRRWALFGKAGVTRSSVHLALSSPAFVTTPSGATHVGTGLIFGAGVTYDFTQDLYARLEAGRYTHVGDEATGKGDIDLYTVGLGMRF